LSGYNPFIGSDTVVGNILFRPQVFRDARGFLLETYHRDRCAALGIIDSLVRDDIPVEFLPRYFTK
jgi:dTDP-4-dehydrorhamnose 3,5-epimerase-like enzyme